MMGAAMVEHYDAIVIGAGQAGPPLAARLGAAGLKTAIIERKLLGGTCVNNGCIPTKTLVGSARAIHMARRGGDYGFSAGEVRVDMQAVKARKDGVVRQSNDGVAAWIAGMKNVTLLWGQAKFTGPRTIDIDGKRTLAADKIFINVGGRASVPDIPGIRSVPFLNNNSMMRLEQVPDHLVIIGGSYISLEFAQMYRRFGSKVSVVELAPKLLGREDDDIAVEIRAILEREGVDIYTGASELSVLKPHDLISVQFKTRENNKEISGSHLLLAVGRVPNTHDLGLKEAGIAADARGFITVDDQCRASAEGVWALGDCNGKGAFTHTSWNDYEIVAANVLDNDPRKISDRIPCYALFIDPPLGRIGMNEAEAKASGRKLLAGKMMMTRVGRAREMGETQGFMKVLVDADSKELLGAAILGLNGDEIVHSLLDVMYAKRPYTTISRAVHIHPTVTELVPTLLQGLKPLA
jgi:pyruvate/2-oxoglutarate dehydrogenase complex dihydrolipoamide dehydrogenase (E3) component